MSSRLSYYYHQPTTPPASGTAEQFEELYHSQTASGSSIYSNDSSPDSVITNLTTPCRSPAVRQHGPMLLPKIRPQDTVVDPMSSGGPYRRRRVLSNARNPPGFVPYSAGQSYAPSTAPGSVDCTLISPVSAHSLASSHAGSAVASPVTITPSSARRKANAHSRTGSSSSIDEHTLSRYGYPTYRELPKYVTQYSPLTPNSATTSSYPSFPPPSAPIVPPPEVCSLPQPAYPYAEPPATAMESPLLHMPPEISPSTTLLNYLTAPTQAISLVHTVAYPPSRSHQAYFWWDVRNLRSWSSFSASTLHSIPNLSKLLTTEISADLTPPANAHPSRLSPSSEVALCDLIRDIYAPRVNAALQISQGYDSLSLYPSPDTHNSSNRVNGSPQFLANYATDTERTISGLPRGRVVGLVKSFDRWNSGMRNEQPHKRVEFLNGLAHLQKCMREHSCRYGFIMTEIELVCVRAGCDEGDDVPYFGYLELAPPIALRTSYGSYDPLASMGGSSMFRSYSSSSSQSSDYSSSSRGASPLNHPVYPHSSGPWTASLALYYLILLSKSVPLPGQPSWHLNVGGSGALTRQRVLPEGKDRWIPEPQTGERRDAKRMRGWVWPQDPWHRREGGGSSRSKPASSSTATQTTTRKKKWHK